MAPADRPAATVAAPAGRQPNGWGLDGFRIQVDEDLLDHCRVPNAGDDPHCPAAGRARLDVNAGDPFQVLRLRLIAPRRSAGIGSSASLVMAR